jgi:hypothetical protein
MTLRPTARPFDPAGAPTTVGERIGVQLGARLHCRCTNRGAESFAHHSGMKWTSGVKR